MPIYNIMESKLRAIFGPKLEEDLSKYGPIKNIPIERGSFTSFGDWEYFIPSDSAWTAGTGNIQLDKAYRIFKKDEKELEVREVIRPQELEIVAMKYVEDIQEILKKNKSSR